LSPPTAKPPKKHGGYVSMALRERRRTTVNPPKSMAGSDRLTVSKDGGQAGGDGQFTVDSE